VTIQVWMDTCSSVLGRAVAWDSAVPLLHVVEADGPFAGLVDYNHFLHRFFISLQEDSPIGASWVDSILDNIFSRLLDRDRSVSELLGMFDQDKDGLLTIPELAEAFRRFDAGITPAQVRALFLTFAAHSDESERGFNSSGCIDVESFLSSFVAIAEEHKSEHARARSSWPKWARRYLRLLGKALWTHTEEHQVLAVFEACDQNKNGLLEPSEFVRVMQHLEAELARGMPSGLAPPTLPVEKLRQLAALADFSGEGRVSYLEILTALQPADTGLGGHVRFDLFEQICRTIWLHKEALLRAFHLLDPRGTMRADSKTLAQALIHLNNTLGGHRKAERPLLSGQIEALVAHIQWDEDGQVDYNMFLGAFQVTVKR